MVSHGFPFEGGEILTYMGATWFVSYAYYDHLDRTQKNWDKVKTARSRINNYNKSRQYHKDWLKHVLTMSDKNLSKNTIGLTPYETKQMASKILKRAF